MGDALARGRWLVCLGALLGGRAFGLTGVVALAFCWPLAEFWTERAPDAWTWTALAAAALGAGSTAGARPALALAVAGSALLLLRHGWQPRGRGRGLPALAACAGISLLAHTGHPALAAAGAVALAQAALLPLAVHAVVSLLELLRARTLAGREGGDAPPSRVVAAAAAAGMCAAGVSGPTPLPVDLRAVAATLALLWLWPVGDGAAAAAAGGVAGWVAGLSGGVGAAGAASLALGGTLAWGMGASKRWLAPLGLAAGAVLTAALAGRGWAWSWGVLLPSAFLAAGRWARGEPTSPPDAVVAVPQAGENGWIERLRACGRACLELSRGLAQVAAGGPEPPPPEREGLRVAEEVCPGCPSLRACWERRLPRARAMVEDLWKAASVGGVHWQQIGGPETIYCLRPREMADVANRHATLARQREELDRLLAASRRSAVAPLLGLGRALAELADEAAAAVGEPGAVAVPADASPPRTFQARWHAAAAGACWGYSTVAAGLARPARAVSGDAFRCRLLPGERLALLLSDGMGSGPLAAIASAAAAEHVLAWLAAGHSPVEALRLGNERLLEEADVERFATIDLAVVHLRAALVEWFKMGAPPSFLCHARGVREFPGGGLPAGILPEPEIRCSRARLRPGDVLVLVSDGILDRVPVGAIEGGPRGRWAAKWLRTQMRADPGVPGPEALAGRMVEAAVRHAPHDHDDLTALVSVLLGPASPIGREGHDEAAIAGPGPTRGA